jgi:ribosomal 50S subunit-recycling heat shock protein
MYGYFETSPFSGASVEEAIIESQAISAPKLGTSIEKLIHLALPVRLIHTRNGERNAAEMACTYDIYTRGARVRSSRELKVGDFLTVERGRMKSLCQVVWAADPESVLRGQFTIECVEGARTPWEEELRQMEEQYLPMIPDAKYKKSAAPTTSNSTQNRRRRPRYSVRGEADVLETGGNSRREGRLEQISEYGCLIKASNPPAPGTGLRLTLNMCDVSIALRGHVRYTADNRAMGVEFQEIRQGDRPLLEYVLQQLKKPRSADFADLEVVAGPTPVTQ